MRRIALLVMLGFAASAQETGVVIHNGFATGEQYLAMSQVEKRAYAMGVISGMLIAPLFGAPKERLQRFEACVEKMTDAQVSAILEKFLRDNPARWHETPHVPMFSALMEACPGAD